MLDWTLLRAPEGDLFIYCPFQACGEPEGKKEDGWMDGKREVEEGGSGRERAAVPERNLLSKGLAVRIVDSCPKSEIPRRLAKIESGCWDLGWGGEAG